MPKSLFKADRVVKRKPQKFETIRKVNGGEARNNQGRIHRSKTYQNNDQTYIVTFRFPKTSLQSIDMWFFLSMHSL